MGVRVVEEEKFDVGGGEEAGDEIVVEAVDVFEVPVFRVSHLKGGWVGY